MIALGLYSGVNGAAAAVVRDGRVVTAVSALSHGTSNLDAASLVARCLTLADLDACHLDRVVVATQDAGFQSGHDSLGAFFSGYGVDDRLSAIAARPRSHIGMDQAHLSQLRLLPVQQALGVIVSQHSGRGGTTARISGGRCSHAASMSGAPAIGSAIHAVALALGYRGYEPVDALERLAHGDAGACDNTFERALFLSEKSGIALDAAALHDVLECARQQSPVRLDQETVHIEANRVRRELAAGILERCSELLSQTIGRLTSTDTTVCAIGGDLFGSAAFARRIARRLERVRFAPVCHDVGAALGVALEPFAEVEPLQDLALGSPFDERDIKDVLENCRLVYMYEPNWAALASRVSHLLSTGALVGWFQGREAFGPDSLGSRSILCDPSTPYARENVNRFLLARDAAEPLAMTVASSAVSHEWPDSADWPLRPLYRDVPASWRSSLRALVDTRGDALMSSGRASGNAEFGHLLDTHYQRTGVPALITVDLGSRTPMSPRDAIRETFASATEFLVMGRFLIAKDYFAMRRK